MNRRNLEPAAGVISMARSRWSLQASKPDRLLAACVVVLAVLAAGAQPPAHALGTAFTYQGQLQQGADAASGLCDFQLSLWDTGGSGAPPAGGNQIGSTQTVSGAGVTNGLFTLALDFGAAAFSTGSDRWVQIAVRCPAGSGSYQILAPRQPLTPAPFALFASSIADGSVSSAKLAPGAVMTSQLATNAVTSAQIADGTITMNDLADGAVNTAKIADGQVTAAKLAAPLSLTSSVAHTFVGAFDGISTGLDSVGVSGTANNGVNACGLYGLANAGYGVVGSSDTGTGVKGVSSEGVGVVGQSGEGPGVKGSSSFGVGVLGEATGSAGVKGTSGLFGVLGVSTGLEGAGVLGQAPSADGVRGISTDGSGVAGESGSGIGILGLSAGNDGVYGESTLSNGYGVHGVANTGESARGVFGDSSDGVGVSGRSTNNIGVGGVGGIGIYGVTNKSDGRGVVGITNAGDSPDAVGVSGVANNGAGVSGNSATGVGVYGKTGAVSTYTIAGVVGEATGDNNIGVRGVANHGTSAWAVNGESTTGYAGYFSGKVNVTGALTAGVKSFKIDHPLDPANKYLMHAAVESPDMKNIYDGIAVLDAGGEAVVELPEWFEALNRDFRYQLTCIGGVAPVYIAEEVHDHRFRIAGGAPGLKVSWQVTGIRKDAFANAHPLEVELDKSAEERGRYLYPVELGMPALLSIDHAKQAAEQAQVQ